MIPKLVLSLGLMAVNMALTMTRTIEGPRLDDLKFTSGDYGSALARTWGKRRLQCPIFWAEDLKEVRQQRKTKGGKYNEYTYFGTFAVALAGHEISGVTRIWADTHLVYDMTGAGPVSPFNFGESGRGGKSGEGILAAGGGFAINDHMAIYYGTEDQEPDPRMQATVEAEFGEGSCPAYRGTPYIIFKDIPLEKFGNRIFQVSVEAVSNPEVAYPLETFDTIAPQPYRLQGATFSSDYSRFMWAFDEPYEIWDVAARGRMIAGNLPAEITPGSRLGLYNDGSFLAVADNNDEMYLFSADGIAFTVQQDFGGVGHRQEEVRVIADADGRERWFTTPWSTNHFFWTDGAEFEMEDLTGLAWQPVDYFPDELGAIWAVGRVYGVGSTTACFYRMAGSSDSTGPSFIQVDGLPAHGVAFGDVSACAHDGHFVLCWDTNDLYRIDRADGSIVTSRTGMGLDVYNTSKQFANLPPASSSIWLNAEEVSLADLSTIRTVDTSDWTAAGMDGMIYDPINHALWTAPQLVAEINILYLDRISGDGVTLGSIAADVADMVGVEDYDFTALDQVVQGWSATQGQARNMLEPLLDAYDSDIRPHDFQLQGVKRAGTSSGTILTERFAANNPRYSVKVRQAAELPRAVTVTFADVDADQQPNTSRADRPLDATGAKGEQSIDMGTWVASADEARQLTDRFHRRIWNERREVSNGLTAQHLALEPGDVKSLDLDGESDTYRLVRVTVKANGELATEWKYDHPSLAVIDGATGANFDGRNPSVIIVPLLSKGFALDIPLLSDIDSDTNPLIYNLAAPYAVGAWPGASLYQATDGEYSDEVGSTASSAMATWGYATTALPDANPWLWDRGSSVNVILQVGAITGTTEAAIDANPRTNMALLGGEIINFTSATLEGDGSYTLSGLKRGRRGTEWACAGHVARDVFLLLDTASAIEMGLSEVGTDLSFKEITSGRTESGAFALPIAPFTGATLKPYAPCHLEAFKESNGDWTLSWVRRTRVGGAWTSGTSIPLSEASEEYEVTVGDGVDDATAIVTSPTYTWTLAAQTTLTGGEVLAGDLVWSVNQQSDAVGDGFLAEATA